MYGKHITVSEFRDDIIPVQWQAWMRHTRETPPTADELLADIQRRKRLVQNVRLLAEKEVAERLAVEHPGASEATVDNNREQPGHQAFQKTAPGESYQPGAWNPESIGADSKEPAFNARRAAAGHHKSQ
ncbi:hypothetical protein LPJ59_002408 [Coemansia sp. RSA 2399]|nr:hypothetical protein LPJ59_002408 [Coemansia sp. RSA 2399]KAJ1905182.1 hypothetical protein LPJ81_002065 [Coemansia sp. IMI 209127]